MRLSVGWKRGHTGPALEGLLLAVAALLGLWLQPAPLAAQESYVPRFQHFGVEDGLAQSSAVCLAQDAQGFLWVGTYAGLSRFDGYGFRNFSAGPDGRSGLADNNIRSLAVSRDGTLWAGTRSGGLSRYDGATQSFTSHLNNTADQGSVPSNEIHAIHEAPNGILLLGTAQGLAEWSPALNRCLARAGEDQPKGARDVMSIAQTPSGAIWVASRKRVSRYDLEAHTLHPLENPALASILPGTGVNTLFADGENTLWVGTETDGLIRVDLATGKADSFIPGACVYRVLRDRRGALWVSCDQGLARYRVTDRAEGFEMFANNPLDPDSLSQNDAMSLLEDASGILWVGTYSGGLNKLVPGSRYFSSYKSIPGDVSSLPGREVSAVLRDRDGLVWVGTRYDGLACMGGENGAGRRKVLKAYRHDPKNPADTLTEDSINCLMEDSKGRIWVGTVDTGLNVLDKKTGRFSAYRHDPADPGSLSQDKIWCLLEDSDGYIWVGTSKAGLNRLNPATGKVTRYMHDASDPCSISHDRVRRIVQARDGSLLIGTNAGLNRLDRGTGKFTHWSNEPGNPGSLSNDRVTPIVEEFSGALWVGTDSGLNRYNPDTGLFTRYGVGQGLADDGIQGLALDRAGKVWMSTFKGISRLDPDTGEVRNYSRRDGLVGLEFTMNAYYQAADGELFFGGFSGLNSFFPGLVEANGHAPPVAICELRVNNRLRPLQGYPNTAEVRLEPADHSLSIDFSGLDFANTGRNRYAYMLEGFDASWVDSGQVHSATYTNLDPGTYRFLVKAANNEGLWGGESELLSAVVVPPYWRTVWFKALLGLMALGAAYSGYAWRLGSLKARRLELEQTVARQTASLRHEIDERVKAEAELRESQQSFQAIFQYSPVAVVISSMADGRLIQVNKAFCNLMGQPVEQLLGRTGLEVGLWEGPEQRREVVEKLREKRLLLNMELGTITSGGRNIYTLCSVTVVDLFKEPCALWLISDISDRKTLEKEIIAARERAEAANQAKSDFLANVSHEIRSPLNAILGLTELAINREPEPEQRTLLEKVTSASHVLLGVINDLLDISKIEAGKMELCPAPFSLRAVLTRLRDIFEHKAQEKGVDFSVEIGPGIPESVLGDSLRLEQVLINLVGNAVKFTERGRVAVTADCGREPDGSVLLRCTVRDSGIGMTPEQLEKVFQPFVQAEGSTSRRFGGTGLGLSIVSRLVAMMGGEVTVQSEQGRGSTFTFTARFAPDAGAGASEVARQGALASLKGLRVLVVDDNVLNRELTAELVRMAGMEPTAAAGGREALELLETKTFDIGLLDVQMPLMDGYQLARAIRDRQDGRRMLLLALTAHAMSGDREKCVAAGMDDYLTKPVMPDVLFSTIGRLVRPHPGQL
ncbi:two-component regulator propeller domain-containing protein [Fundidesulfovibrio agrisoli]|uniref:two-component regulator propeller domain-containing protein n=1 Tax=Fundidesulfovibrio agrisoli TaxID=2922717 RepID=UPI001FAE4B2B|nr:two-component regulator propeller domain-containing protein [Fundidesulfovibrio agrisoli]